jgi:phosphate transport system protein
MTRETLDKIEQHLLDEILIMGSMVEQAVLQSVDALKNRDIEGSKAIYRMDEEINLKRFQIENETVAAIAMQAPAATDLRLFASILEICTELERMGDYAKGIAKINIKIGEEELLKPLVDIPKMAKIGTKMLRKALQAFVKQKTKKSKEICQQDDKVDELYRAVYNDLIEIIRKDPTTADRANQLLWAAHYLERLADRVTNICERTHYVKTGELLEMADYL